MEKTKSNKKPGREEEEEEEEKNSLKQHEKKSNHRRIMKIRFIQYYYPREFYINVLRSFLYYNLYSLENLNILYNYTIVTIFFSMTRC